MKYPGGASSADFVRFAMRYAFAPVTKYEDELNVKVILDLWAERFDAILLFTNETDQEYHQVYR